MNKWNDTPQFEQQITAAFGVPPIRQAFVQSLERQILQKAATRTPAKKSSGLMRRRPGWVIAMAILTLLVAATLIIGPRNVYAAILRLFGYIPGVGVVEQDEHIRVLVEPVQLTRDGVTVSVNRVVLTGTQTKLDYGVAGVPLSAYPCNEAVSGCMDMPYFLLPSGSHVDALSEAPLPADIEKAAFVLPCIFNTLPDTVPTDWILLLHFMPAPDDFVMLPVQNVTPQAIETPVLMQNITSEATLEPTQPPTARVSVEKVIDIDDGYILAGKITRLQQDVTIEQHGVMVIRDAEGKKVPSTFVNDLNEYELMDIQPGEIPFSFQFKGSGVVFPITITIPGIELSMPDKEASTTMTFNAGENPQPGQEWQVNQPFTLAGHNIMLESVSAGSQISYSFKFKGDDEVYGLAVGIENYPGLGGGGSGVGPEHEFWRTIAYETLPAGELTLKLWNLVLTSPMQQWTTTWQPQTAREFQVDPQKASACLNAENLADIPAVPDTMEGWLVFTQLNPQLQLVLADLHGQEQQILAAGGSRAALTLDAAKVAYNGQEGVTVLDLASRESVVLPNNHGYFLHWSPDGSHLAFENPNDSFGVFISDPAGGNVRQLSNLGYETIAGWSPDGRLVYYAIPFVSEDGSELMAANVEDGSTQDLFVLDHSSLKAPYPAISPNGQWVAYRASDSSSLYIKAMDGSGLRLLLDQPGGAINGIQWDRDSHFLGVSILDGTNDGTIILLDPQNCETYRIPGINGELNGLNIP